LLALIALGLASGCDRTPRLVPAAADSTAAIPSDSTSIYVQMARDDWDDPAQMEEAAGLIARVLLDDLRAHPRAGVTARARDLLDSLTTGAEVYGRDDLAIVNLFARSNPSGGSWPWIYWRDKNTVRAQGLDAVGMHLVGVAVEPAAGTGSSPSATRVAGLFTRTGPQGQQPFAFVWQRPPDGSAFRLGQSLGADSLGSTGTARLVESATGGAVLVTHTYQVARGFDECGSCPHVFRTRTFRWGAPGLVKIDEDIERTPYYSFVQFIAALAAGDREAAERLATDGSVVDAATGYQWGQSKGLWRLSPGSAPNARDLILLRGSQEAYKVHFAAHGDDWVISGLEPSNRNIE
jgi:hypothetical protein